MAASSPPGAPIHVNDPTRGRFGNARRIEICRPGLERGLDYVAHHTSGGLDFAVDRLEASGAGPADRRRLEGLGTELAGRFAELDAVVRAWHSGDLIRLVLHGTERLIVCNSVTADQLLISSAPVEPGLMHRQDRAAAELVEALRRLIDLQSQNPGGFQSRPPDEPAGPDESPGEPWESCPPTDPQVEGEHSAARTALRAAVHPADLHFAAYLSGGAWRCAADVLDHAALAAFYSREFTAADRRGWYEEFGRRLCLGPMSLLGQLSLDLEDQIGELWRLVLDVEQGAFYGYRRGIDDFVLGATLAQNRVQKADEKVERLLAAVAE
ncbi:hypothetical protein [Dactylosporangium matsuzakiense]|uniref:Uncharacterized protein n=1 Tax=Dactylosporangium matsuzakiense TaxID=53360 RepID=A0A9W6KD58_9ACTN|nr:hypothetical protein [Dactylosporangium matsuzakiense]UWZ47096.1 hypothetical protein Dmats_12235 [Dactylosporangium matsuzakiense]GLK98469.1 hypothetical protein GCM10017581_002100 [Dactylosporangium matsuzakiense]